jgi:hypothetical protein
MRAGRVRNSLLFADSLRPMNVGPSLGNDTRCVDMGSSMILCKIFAMNPYLPV